MVGPPFEGGVTIVCRLIATGYRVRKARVAHAAIGLALQQERHR